MGIEDALHDLVRDFVTEAQEICERITHDLLDLERTESSAVERDALYEGLARGLHTLKGSAGSLGLRELSQLAHRMEDAIQPRQKAHAPLPTVVADALLEGLDQFMSRLRAESAQSGSLPDVRGVLARIDTLAETAPPSIARPADLRTAAATSTVVDEAETFRVDARDVASLMQDVERLREVRLRLEERRREVERGLATLPRGLEASVVLGGVSRALRADAEEAADLVEGLEGRVKAIGEQAARRILEPLHRAVRDLCRTTGKEAQLSIIGADVSLDRRALRPLGDAIVQLVRNAIDHGVETPEERERAGKHAEAALVVRIERQGNSVFVEISDDGRGLDLVRIREVAVERGFLDAEAAAKLGPMEAAEMIFVSGFSTHRVVTETSGRGVGMDVVRERVRALRGRIDVESRPGQGTRCTIILPVETGGTHVLLVRAGTQDFGVPMLAVERVLLAKRSDLVTSSGETVLTREGQRMPLLDLGELLGLRSPSVPADGRPVLVVQAQGERVGLAVDDVEGDRDFTVRPLPAELESCPAFEGAATTARGELVLVLRPSWLLTARAEPGPEVAVRRALVVDDSLTARALHRAMLEAGGYTVHTAELASQALELSEHGRYDLIVCDLAMEPVDGLALTKALRTRSNTATVPIVVVSGRDAPEDAARALAAGADAFLSKSACARGGLLAEVRSVSQRKRGAA